MDILKSIEKKRDGLELTEAEIKGFVEGVCGGEIEPSQRCFF